MVRKSFPRKTLLLASGTQGLRRAGLPLPTASRVMDENQMAVNCRVLKQCLIRCAEGATNSGLSAMRGALTVSQVPNGMGRER